MREAIADLRRHLVGVVGVLERIGGIEPVCRVCAGCPRCEVLHRQQRDPMMAKRVPQQTVAQGSRN